MDRTISYKSVRKGRSERLSVAVVVDNLPSEGDTRPLGRRISWIGSLELVRGAVGYDEARRGDRVTVINAALQSVEKFEPVIRRGCDLGKVIRFPNWI